MNRKRTIFDTASWADMQRHKNEEVSRYKRQITELNQRLAEKTDPITPEMDVNMETEATGHQAQIETQKEKIVQTVQDAVEDIKVTLQAPKGFILFPEPEDTGQETTYEVKPDSET